jgi:hypothetical protein
VICGHLIAHGTKLDRRRQFAHFMEASQLTATRWPRRESLDAAEGAVSGEVRHHLGGQEFR